MKRLLILLLVVAVGAILFATFGGRADNAERIEAYRGLVEVIEKGNFGELGTWKQLDLPESKRLKTKGILFRKSEDGNLIVEFHERAGFPLKHSGILYCSSANGGAEPEVQKRWKNLHRLELHWFAFSD